MIRVIRLLEYEFESLEKCDLHFMNLGVPTNGVQRFGNRDQGNIVIRSAVIVAPFEKEEDDGLTPFPLPPVED